MKNDGPFKRQLSYFKEETLGTMRSLTLPSPPSVFLLDASLLRSVSIPGVAQKDL